MHTPMLSFKLTDSTSTAIKANIKVALHQYQQHHHSHSQTNPHRYLKFAQKVVAQSVKPFGYFSAKTTAHTITQQGKAASIISITLGRPVLIHRITVSITGPGRHDHAFIKLLQHISLKKGDILVTPKYEKIKDRLFNIASNKGYFKANMQKSIITISKINHSATIEIVFSTGNRYYFGQTQFTNNKFNKYFLARYLAYHKGEPYSNHKIQLTQQRLSSNGYFQQVIITPSLNHTRNFIIPIHITLKPVIRTNYILGLGYGTDTGIRGIINISNNYINSYGHKLVLESQLASADTNVSLSYIIPGKHPYSERYTITGAFSNISQTTGHSNGTKLSAGYNVVSGFWSSTYAINALDEFYSLSTLRVRTRADLIYPSLTWQYLNSNNKLNPDKGLLAKFYLSGTPKLLATKSGFTQIRVLSRWLATLNVTHTRLLVSDEIAHTQISSINNLPLSLQLFTGGSQTVRGYDYNSIGPGKNLFLASVEIQQKIYKRLYLTGFFDIGNVANLNVLFQHPKKGIGGGLAYLTPIGMFELDYAIALDSPNQPGKIEFSLGPFL